MGLLNRYFGNGHEDGFNSNSKYFFLAKLNTDVYEALGLTDFTHRVNFNTNTIRVYLPSGYDITEFIESIDSIPGMDLVKVNGSFGKPSTVSPEERKKIIELASNGGRDRVTDLFSEEI